MSVDNGTGTTVTFGTSSITANVTAISDTGVSREAIETTHLGTTGGRTYIPGDIYEPGEITLSVQFDPDKNIEVDILRVAETVTITYPLASGQSTASAHASSGFITSYGNVEVAGEALMSAEIVVKKTGALTTTPST